MNVKLLYKIFGSVPFRVCKLIMESLSKIRYQGIRKVQMRATKSVTRLCHKSYQEWLRILDLPILKFRRLRGNMIETYKVLSGIYDTTVSPRIPIIPEYAT